MLAGQILVEALNGSDESTKDELLRLIESCGYTVRSDEEEAALRQLVNLADVNSAAALGEPPSLDDAAMWADACFMQLREQSRMEISCHRRRPPLRSSRSSYSSQSSSRSRSRSRSSSIPRSMLTDGVSLTAAAISSVLTRLQLPGGGPNISSSIRCSS